MIRIPAFLAGGPVSPGLTGPQIQVSISEPIIQVVQVGSSVTFRCNARSLSGTQVRSHINCQYSEKLIFYVRFQTFEEFFFS